MITYSKWHGQTCPVCFDGILADGERTGEITYQSAVFKWHQRGAFCPVCGDGMVEGDVDQDALYKAFRDRVDAAIASKMEVIREELHIPKAAMTHFVGGGKNGFNRYVTQQTKPTPAVWNLMRAMQEYPDLVEKLSRPFMEVDADELSAAASAHQAGL